MASQPKYVPLLIGMGIRELSVNPGSFFAIKAIVHKCDAKLFTLTENLDFNSSLWAVEQLLEKDLKPYSQNKEE